MERRVLIKMLSSGVNHHAEIVLDDEHRCYGDVLSPDLVGLVESGQFRLLNDFNCPVCLSNPIPSGKEWEGQQMNLTLTRREIEMPWAIRYKKMSRIGVLVLARENRDVPFLSHVVKKLQFEGIPAALVRTQKQLANACQKADVDLLHLVCTEHRDVRDLSSLQQVSGVVRFLSSEEDGRCSAVLGYAAHERWQADGDDGILLEEQPCIIRYPTPWKESAVVETARQFVTSPDYDSRMPYEQVHRVVADTFPACRAMLRSQAHSIELSDAITLNRGLNDFLKAALVQSSGSGYPSPRWLMKQAYGIHDLRGIMSVLERWPEEHVGLAIKKNIDLVLALAA